MNFWQNVQMTAGMGGAFYWVVLCFVVAAFILFGLVPAERLRIRTAVLLFALSFAGLLTAGALLSYGISPESTAYRWTSWASRLIESIAIINLASVLVFDVALEAMRLKPPRIMRDLLIAFSYIIVAITLLSRSGVDLTGIVATSAVITAVICFYLSDTLSHHGRVGADGVHLSLGVGAYSCARKPRDGAPGGRLIETRNWDTIVIPNSVLMKGQVTLLGRRAGAPRQHRQWVYFNVDFRYTPTDVIDAVEAALRAEPIPNVALEPAPHCLVVDFKESFARYAARRGDLALTDTE